MTFKDNQHSETASNPVAEKTPHACYRLDGILYVPHYKKPWIFVGPGSVEVKETRLKALNAHPVIVNLWPR